MLLVGVLIALVLRAIFIAAGAAIIASFAWVFYIFGAFLICTAWKLIQEARADERGRGVRGEPAAQGRPRSGSAWPTGTTAPSCGSSSNGKRVMTPMLVVMLAIGTTDVLFALDSIPAIFGLTQDPYIVFTANAFALMGLRQLYFLHRRPAEEAGPPVSYGLSVILGFIGVKLVLHALHESGVHVPEISIPVSLGVICAVLVVTTITSLRAAGRQEEPRRTRPRRDAPRRPVAQPGNRACGRCLVGAQSCHPLASRRTPPLSITLVMDPPRRRAPRWLASGRSRTRSPDPSSPRASPDTCR